MLKYCSLKKHYDPTSSFVLSATYLRAYASKRESSRHILASAIESVNAIEQSPLGRNTLLASSRTSAASPIIAAIRSTLASSSSIKLGFALLTLSGCVCTRISLLAFLILQLGSVARCFRKDLYQLFSSGIFAQAQSSVKVRRYILHHLVILWRWRTLCRSTPLAILCSI